LVTVNEEEKCSYFSLAKINTSETLAAEENELKNKIKLTTKLARYPRPNLLL